jgi:hypothetical protein
MRLPLWIKLADTAFVAVLVPLYAARYGAGNFLWFSDVALLTSVPALWFENALLASMMAVGVLLPELAWNLDFFGRLASGRHVVGLSRYMFDASIPRGVRALSLFHVFLPALLVWMVARLGYDRRAWLAQSMLGWALLMASYWLTRPEDNVNWVFGPGRRPQTRLPRRLYLAIVMLFFPLVVYAPTHLLLQWAFPPPRGKILDFVI